MRSAGEQITLVVIAASVSEHEVLNGIDSAPDTWNEVICVTGSSQAAAAVKAPVALQCGQAVTERLGRT